MTNREHDNALELAWGLIANASGGDWTKQSQEWQTAAAKWRDEHYHPLLMQREEYNELYRDIGASGVAYGEMVNGEKAKQTVTNGEAQKRARSQGQARASMASNQMAARMPQSLAGMQMNQASMAAGMSMNQAHQMNQLNQAARNMPSAANAKGTNKMSTDTAPTNWRQELANELRKELHPDRVCMMVRGGMVEHIGTLVRLIEDLENPRRYCDVPPGIMSSAAGVDR